MTMSKGNVHGALSSAFFGLILAAAPVLAQGPAHRSAARTTAPQTRKARHPHGGLTYVPDRYMVFLSDEPVTTHFAKQEQLRSAAALAYRQQIETRQAAVKQALVARNVEVVGSASMVVNAIFVVAPAERVAELRNISGVVGVMPERRIQPNLNKATALANAPAAWAQSSIGGQNNAGNGIKIGIIDTGIDIGNPAFNDTGFTAPPGFPKCNPVVNATPTDCGAYTNNKVIVARSYVSMIANGGNGAANSIPDDYSARDRDGHGSAVAAVAAGVQNSGGTVAFSGMAPKAYLGSYKVFGSTFVSNNPSEGVVIKALDDAISDGMNVINYSSGVPAVAGAKDDVQCGNPKGTPCDPLAYAFENAAENGAIITVAAGNFGGDPYGTVYHNTITSPATAPSVISVGATINSHVFNSAVSVNGSGVPSNLKGIASNLTDAGFTYDYFPAVDVLYPLPAVGALSGTLVDVATLGDNGQACSPLPVGSLTDVYALIQQSPSGSGCTFDTKAQNATAAGAIGVVFYAAAAGPLPAPQEGVCYANSNLECDLVGPGVIISVSDGQNLKSYIDAHPGASVTIDTAGAEASLPSGTTANMLASYSSLGPAIDGSIKPDLVATGGFDGNFSILPSATNGMYTAGESYDPNGELYSSNGYVAANGTSFAAPLVAGAAAMVLQAHPTWTAAQVKSALVNYAAQSVNSDDNGNTVDVQEIGAGLLDANAAVTAAVTAVPSTLSFGYVSKSTTLPVAIPLSIQNNGSASVTLAVAVTAGIPASGATVKTDQTTMTLAGGGGKATLNVSLNGTSPAAGEYNGVVTLTSASPAVTVRIPYMFLVGDGTQAMLNPLYDMGDWQTGGVTVAYGAVNQDLGPLPVQVIDQWGVPVAGTNVTYTVSPSGTINLKPVPGSPGSTNYAVPFQPSNCSPSTSGSTVTCTTNNYGVAWVEMVTGSTAVGSSNASTIDASIAAGADVPDYVSIIPVPNVTSVQDDGAFGTTLSPGSYVAMFGTNFADANYLTNPAAGDKVDTTFSSGRLPLAWDYVTVSFDAPASGNLPAISVPGYVEYVSAGQINVFVPWELENYPSAKMKEIYSGTAPIFSNAVTVPLNNYTPAFFMYNSGPVFIADAVDPTACPKTFIVTTSCPAAAGDLVEFYANGLGPTTNQPPSGSPAPSDPNNLAHTTSQPIVTIGGKQAQVQFAGLAPGYVGLYQVNAFIPSGLASGNQPITISIGNVTSPTSITGGGTTYQIVLPIK